MGRIKVIYLVYISTKMNILTQMFGRFVGGKKQAVSAPPEQKAIPQQPGFRFIGGGLVPYDRSKLTYLERGYMVNEMVYSVVKLQVDKAKCAPMAAYLVQDEQKYFEYQRYAKQIASGEHLSGKDYFAMREAKHKSLKLYNGDAYLNNLLQQPTEDMTMDELNEALFTFLLTTGDYFEGGWDTFTGGLNKGKPMGQYELPSQYMWIVSSDSLPLRDEGYELAVGGRMTFTREQVLHSRMFNPNWTTVGSSLYGFSPLEAFRLRLQAANLGTARQAKIMENAGADVVVYLDDPETVRQYQDWSIEQMSVLKERWDAEQAGFLNAGKAVWSPNKVGVARMGLTLEELGQLPAEMQNLRSICNLYNVPSQLMNDPENKIYSNQVEGQKALIYNCVLPLLWKRQKAYTNKLRKCDAYRDSRIVVEFDTSIYKELEANKKELVEWLEKSRFNNETFYQYMDQEIPADMPEEVRKAILIPSGYQLMDDLFTGQQDISGTINDLNNSGDNPYPVS